jgi:serine/threonine protein kinase
MNRNRQESIVFGKYHLLDKIATGGMAELFRAKLTGVEGFEKLIAIKKILQHLNSEDKLVSAFIEEAKLAANLHHPNIVQIYDFGYMNETYYIAMEYLSGRDLRFVFRRALDREYPLTIENALYIVLQVLSGLDYAHTFVDFSGNPMRIIHRDIGPQNLFVTFDGQVKIIDFGIAKADTQDTNTQFGTIKGKVSYMSPEQANGDPIDYRSDLYSVGIVLYELVTNRKIHEGDTFQILARVREGFYDPVESITRDLPAELYTIINKALEKDPGNRYQTAEEMSRDIERFIHEHSMRMTQRDLAAYMRKLFDTECDDTETRYIDLPLTPDDPEKVENTLVSDTIDVIPDPMNKSRIGNSQRIRYFAIAAFAILILAGAGLSLLIQHGMVSDDSALSRMIPHALYSRITFNTNELEKGVKAVEEKRDKEAIQIFEGILRRDPSLKNRVIPYYTVALTSLGSKLMKSNKKRAQILLEKSYELNPQNSETCANLGKLCTVWNENRKALEYYDKASKLDPVNPDIYFNMGYNYAILDDYGKAKEMYKIVIDLAPSFIDQAYFNLALIQDKTGMPEDALKNMRKALKANPDNLNALKYINKQKIQKNNSF